MKLMRMDNGAMWVEYVERINEIAAVLCSMFMDMAIYCCFSILSLHHLAEHKTKCFCFFCIDLNRIVNSSKNFHNINFFCSIEMNRKFGNDTNNVCTSWHVFYVIVVTRLLQIQFLNKLTFPPWWIWTTTFTFLIFLCLLEKWQLNRSP